MVGDGGCACSVMSNSATPWTVACQAPLSMGFSKQEYWSGLPFPSPGDLPDPGIKPWSPAAQVDSLPFELQRDLLEIRSSWIKLVGPKSNEKCPYKKRRRYRTFVSHIWSPRV